MGTNEEILKKAIEKAVGNGWKPCQFPVNPWDWLSKELPGEEWDFVRDVYPIIFNHDFARAFWGEGKYDGWQYHLQQMVLEEEPLKYIERFL